MSDVTVRLGLPTIRPGQAQKEISHNEALLLIDLLMHGSVTAMGVDSPPFGPAPGAAWIVGSAPTGAWAGKAGHLAGWGSGGWRFVAPIEGMTLWVSQAHVHARFSDGAWTLGALAAVQLVIAGDAVVGARSAAIADPVGGGNIDVESRAAVSAILSALRGHGLIAT